MPALVCVITQNIGCLDSKELLEIDARTVKRTGLLFNSFEAWTHERNPDIVVMHFQEIGGKRRHGLFQELLDGAIRGALPSTEYWCSGLMMYCGPGINDFTALGSAIWVRNTVTKRTKIFNYQQSAFVDLLTVTPPPTLSTSDFMFGYKFSEAEKSRKGIVITSLLFDERKMFFVNIHLFHDADNITAMSKSPSEYAEKRSRGLVETFKVLLTKGAAPSDSIFVFGDLNTRLDGFRFVEHSNATTEQVVVQKKVLKMPHDLWSQFSTPAAWSALRKFDTEGQAMMDHVAAECKVQLCELPRDFGPTYSIENEEGIPECGEYKEERLPAWCDRVFANASALTTVSEFQYWVCPLHVLDHRGVYLMFTMLE